MKKGKLILCEKVYSITFEKNPSLEIELFENSDKTNNQEKWLPFEMDIDVDLKNNPTSTCFIIDEYLNVFKLHDADINKGTITFERCEFC